VLERLVQDIHWSIFGILHADVASSQIGTGQVWTNPCSGAFGSGEAAQFLSAPAVSEPKGGADYSDRSLETKIKEEVQSQQREQSKQFVTFEVMEEAFTKGVMGLASTTADHMRRLDDRMRGMESALVHNESHKREVTKEEKKCQEKKATHSTKSVACAAIADELQQDISGATKGWCTTAPKRPVGAFFLWMANKRANHAGEVDGQTSKEWARLWQTMGPDEKAPWSSRERR